MNKEKKILLTGGHGATTALAVIEALRSSEHISWHINWIGAKKAFAGSSLPTFEQKVFPQLGVTTYTISSERLQRYFSLRNLVSLLVFPIGIFEAFVRLMQIRPDIILSFGGYVALPVVIAAYLVGIPVILHEQTIVAGLTNKISSFLVKKVFISRQESREHYSDKKVIHTGNPIMWQILDLPKKKKLGKNKTILVMGGSRGSQIINSALESILPDLVKIYRVIHLTGNLDFKKFASKKFGLRYQAFEHIDPREIYKLYDKADIMIARAGANTVSELIALGLPSILIPISWTRFDEQNKNATYAKNLGIASIIEEKNLSGKSLLLEISNTFHEWSNIVSKINQKDQNIDRNASKYVVKLLESFVS